MRILPSIALAVALTIVAPAVAVWAGFTYAESTRHPDYDSAAVARIIVCDVFAPSAEVDVCLRGAVR